LENTRNYDRRDNSFDINRDFPYNVDSNENCLNTIASRVVHELFTSNLFVSALTFHGGTSVLGYPWGSYNHAEEKYFSNYVSKESPDMVAFSSVGKLINEFSCEDTIRTKNNQRISKYLFGDISSTIYPVNGGLEDWAYGGGWDFSENASFL
jgi:hypothetical protein